MEYDIESGDDKKTKAVNVTGPEGVHVQGAPRRASHGGRGGRGGRDGRGKKKAEGDVEGKADAAPAPAADAVAA